MNKIGVPEENGLLQQLKQGSWPNMGTGIDEVMAITEGEIEAKCLQVDGEQHG